MQTQLLGVFTGKVGFIGDEQHASAIVKSAVQGEVRVTKLGLAGDAQADKRVHGGSEKAVHQFARATYAALAEAFPKAEVLTPGGLGENLSADDMDESNVFIGDIYQIGSVVLQVSQPRRPCWKINERMGVKGPSLWVQEHAKTGWYYRVLEEGTLKVGDVITLQQRSDHSVSIAQLWQIYGPHQPDLDAMEALLNVSALNEDWKKNVANRLAWWKKKLGVA